MPKYGSHKVEFERWTFTSYSSGSSYNHECGCSSCNPPRRRSAKREQMLSGYKAPGACDHDDSSTPPRAKRAKKPKGSLSSFRTSLLIKIDQWLQSILTSSARQARTQSRASHLLRLSLAASYKRRLVKQTRTACSRRPLRTGNLPRPESRASTSLFCPQPRHRLHETRSNRLCGEVLLLLSRTPRRPPRPRLALQQRAPLNTLPLRLKSYLKD